MKRINSGHVFMLFSFALAEKFTSPTSRSFTRDQKLRIVQQLQERGLIAPVTEPGPGRPLGALRLTDEGRKVQARTCSHMCAVNAAGTCLACGRSVR